MPASTSFRALATTLAVTWFGLFLVAFALLSTARGQEANAAATSAAQNASSADPEGVEFFEKRVRPLLSTRCHECHGPAKQKGNLRLDSRDAVLRGGDTGPALVPGNPDDSLLVSAIRYGETYQMPPKSQLPAEEIATLVEWVRRGAPWGAETAVAANSPGKTFDLAARAKHWSFQPIAAAEPPEVGDPAWIKTPIDRFVLAGLEAAGLKPAPAADKRTLLRRVTYDLVGLPPTPAEIDAFLADDSPGAYARVVERLLASPQYGERWARHWLDLVRYAETWGHEFDPDMPNAYRYRDYVIRALNADLPYNQFVVEHLAGDLLDPPRRHPIEQFNESVIATGCYFFGEAKHSPVDVRQDEADRVDNQIDVLAKTFLALTVSCARCHDHKFDPITTKDYYALAGYLQSSRYQQAFIDPPDAQADLLAELAQVRSARRDACREFARAAVSPHAGQVTTSMLAGLRHDAPPDPVWQKYVQEQGLKSVDDVLHPWAMLTANPDSASFASRAAALGQQFTAAQSAAPPVVQVVGDFRDGSLGDWRATGHAFGTSAAQTLDWMFVGPRARFPGRLITGSAAHSGLVSARLKGVLRSPTFEITKPNLFYRLYGNGGTVRLIVDGLQLIQNPIYGGLKFAPTSEQPYWHQQDVSKWVGHRAYIELLDEDDAYLALEQVFCADSLPPAQPNRLVAQLLVDDAPLTPERLAEKYRALFTQVFADWLDSSSTKSAADGLDPDRARIVSWILEQALPADETFKGLEAVFTAQAVTLDARQRELQDRLVPARQALAIADGTAENEHVFVRGSHKNLGDEVPRRFLEVLGGTRQQPTSTGSGRLELARQVASSDNPLFLRVIVNRLWLHHFGEGIVRSPDDFGVMGQPPTNPALLDFLAAELPRQDWSLKEMHRLMVLSNAYQMSSQASAEAHNADPQNRLLHSMNVRRLEAETIRDAVLAVSGRLDATMFGPGVMPHLTAHMVGRGRPANSGPLDGNGRRSIYLAVRRNFLSPLFLAFDYPIPLTTIGRRTVSNVPAQALAMMNNPFVVEQARLWGSKVASDPAPPAERVRTMYVTALGRLPDETEQRSALEFLAEAHKQVASAAGASRTNQPTGDGTAAPGASETNATAVGDPIDPAAWSELAHVLMNLKEFVFVR